MASSQEAAVMCGTPSASRAMVAPAETGAAIWPEVSGRGRNMNQ